MTPPDTDGDDDTGRFTGSGTQVVRRLSDTGSDRGPATGGDPDVAPGADAEGASPSVGAHGLAFGALAAAAVAVLVGAGLGPAVGAPLGALLSAGGGLLVGASTRGLSADENRWRAAGSVALSVGALAALAGPAYALSAGAGALVYAVSASVGVAAVGMDAFPDEPTDPAPPVGRAVEASAVVVVVAALAGATLYSGIPLAVAVGSLAIGAAVVGSSAFAALVALQVLAVVTALLVREALPVLDRWLPGERTDGPLAALEGAVTREGSTLSGPVGVVAAVVVVQLVLLALDPSGGWFAALLAPLSVLGDAVSLVLRLGLLHLPVAALGTLAAAVLAGRGLQRLAVWWADPSPPTTLAFGAGGAVAALAVLAGGLAVGEAYGGVAVLLGLAAALVTVRFAVAVPDAVGGLGFVPESAGGYAVGSALLFVGALGAAAAGATPVVAFAAAAGAILAWDLGSNAALLREQLGRRVRTRRVEVTHATASALVGLLAVGVATVAHWLYAPAGIAPGNRTRALAALTLAVAAMVAFVYRLENPLDDGGEDEPPADRQEGDRRRDRGDARGGPDRDDAGGESDRRSGVQAGAGTDAGTGRDRAVETDD